jgi:alpha-D-ribose 1-methylphosphonate 5-triphosphate synthase subunit PhnG
MRRKKRTEILINGSRKLAETLAQEITDKYEVIVIEEPNDGLVMVKMRETAKKSLFYLGEVFVSECKVQISGCLGIGIVAGHHPELSRQLAIIDAAYNAGLKETESWEKELLAEEERVMNKRMMFNSGVLRTKVDFETMDVE